jgi:arylsulfatase A-like enzyme
MNDANIRASLASMGLALLAGCGGGGDLPVLTADMPLHLEDHIDGARVSGSVAPPASETIEWRFDGSQTDWRQAISWSPTIGSAQMELTGEALRVTLSDSTRNPSGVPNGGIYVRVPEWRRSDWGDVVVRMRSDSTVNAVGVRVNLREGRGVAGDFPNPFLISTQQTPIVRDGTVQTYRIRWPEGEAGAVVRDLGIWFSATEGPGSVDLVSVSVSPIGELYRDPPLGVRQVANGGRSRRTLYAHAPSRLEFRVTVPAGGRLDTGMRILSAEAPVTSRVSVASARGETKVLVEEVVSDASAWLSRTADLAEFAGETVTLALENESASQGAVALWSAPTVSGSTVPDRPNVILYIIDGGGADQMSLYGYNRRTTPNLEALAQEGAVFEWAHSNSSWSKPSTTSFMTSLQNSVLGNTRQRFDPLPSEAKTMAQHFHDAGYQTAVFTSNPWAGSASSLEGGVDEFRDQGVNPPSRSSVELHREFWEWRETYPGTPYWVHFQTTDVHGPNTPQPPFGALFVPPGTVERVAREDSLRNAWFAANRSRLDLPTTWVEDTEGAGLDVAGHFDARRGLYDETLAHQDHQLGRLVEQLKHTGEWENTLLVIAADHSVEAGTGDFLIGLRGAGASLTPRTLLRSSISRVPLVFVWPGRIPGGQRIRERVSMIDVLPTVLELAGLPEPDAMQGQSLAPLLLGRDGWEPRPVIFDEFTTDLGTGALTGRLEMIDGRWGASLWVGEPEEDYPRLPLLLYDVSEDPMALSPVNDEHPELVTKYTELLTRQWEAHQLLAKRFTPGGAVELTPEQLETLRTLGYIR